MPSKKPVTATKETIAGGAGGVNAIKEEKEICHKEIVLEHFTNRGEYKKFVLDRADYQRTLEEIKHQFIEE